jgi:hypothetical protein
MAQIAIIEPKLIVPLGAPALRTLVSPNLKISTARCKVFRKSGIMFIPLYHPAAALHRAELQTALQQDILTLKELINREIREDEITDLPSELDRAACGADPAHRATAAVVEAPPAILTLF